MMSLLLPALLVAVLMVSPACAALLALEAQIARGVKTSLTVMLRALPKYWARSVALGLLVLFPVLVGLFTISIVPQTPVPFVVQVGLAADVVGVVLLVAL